MPQNLELKATIVSTQAATRIARNLRARSRGLLHQKDIYFAVKRGRLKLRIIRNSGAELIYYHRPNKKGRRLSRYDILPISNSKVTATICTAVFGRKTVVEKKRRLFLYKNARIHIDSVKNLGDFLEFEVIVKSGIQQARSLLDFLVHRFNVKRSSFVAVSYSDLMLRRRNRRSTLL